ncbi:SprT family zinc-dependent metalloprotease [Pseudoalteromonas distincta]|uniref:M48 family metallopeptidase n=1 Tax=Pseudoalteromonas sp. NSLLW218 TaxID=2792048 RepID=UPI0018CD3134|nr:SprT family zinc-dependent metalloprotease [Pseudoalteromonas sp. NSLLW218]MBH0090335.1 M48 family metallopeptidase [Pseudoalteromonas sp. NSLLW218]
MKKSTRRKTVAIKVHSHKVTVYAPHFVAKKHIDTWLFDKQEWVAEQLKKQSSIDDTKQYPFKSKKISVFSEMIYLRLEPGQYSKVTSNDEHLLITISPRVKNDFQKYQQLLETYLKEQLIAYIEMRLAYFCTLMGEELPNDLKIGVYKRKWGSCNSKRELTFNLHLIGAPYHAIDYVIVHELAHLKYLNHSKAFWQRVETFFPDYKTSSNWLKQNGMSLQWVF